MKDLLFIVLANIASLALYCAGRRLYRRYRGWWSRWRRRNEPKDTPSATLASLSYLLKSVYPAEAADPARMPYRPVRVSRVRVNADAASMEVDCAPQGDPGDEDRK